MLSRAVSRALPRTSSRLTQCTARTAFTSSLASPLRRTTVSPLLQCSPRAAFSTTRQRWDNVSQELSIKLASEIAIEEENSDAQHDSDAGVQRFLDENDFWALEAPEGHQDVLLRRTYDDEVITVSFSILDFNTSAMGIDGEDADDAFIDEEEELGAAQSGGANTKGAINKGPTGNANFKVAPEDSIAPADREELRSEEDDYEPQHAFPANVTLLIQRPGKGALRINLVTDNGRFTIHGLTHLPEGASTATAADLLRNTPEQLYTGPPFQQLDEEVQSLMEQYLDVRGVNTALALFIPDYIDVKEQKEYLRWLQRVKDFVE